VYIIPDMNEQAGTLVVNGATMTNLAQGLAGQTWNFEGIVEHLGVPLPPPDRDALEGFSVPFSRSD
jgi:hypothetical protein